jgi:hypothetical protein
MSENSALVAIFGEIDKRLAETPELRPRVALLLPEFASEEPWYDDFLAWTERLRTEHEGDAFPDLATALDELSKTPPAGRMRARRLLAITGLVRARPEFVDADSEEAILALQSLLFEGIQGDADKAGLLGFLATPEQHGMPDGLAPNEYWDVMINIGSGLQLLAAPQEIGWRPCSTNHVVVATPHGEVDAVALLAGFETTKLSFEDALGFINPSNWAANSAFWCSVDLLERLGEHDYRYHEVVSVDCPNKANTWWIGATLDFHTTMADDGLSARTRYAFPPDPPGPGPHVLVDEGSLVVTNAGGDGKPRVRVTATKRVAFNGAFGGVFLLKTICALGFVAALEDLVFDCAGLPAEPC